jgi:hypothetical protein
MARAIFLSAKITVRPVICPVDTEMTFPFFNSAAFLACRQNSLAEAGLVSKGISFLPGKLFLFLPEVTIFSFS